MSKHILPCLVVFLFLFSASGQELASNPKAGEDSRSQQELNKKADALLSEIVQHARDLKNKENQIIAKAAVADLLWKDHEANARILYRQAFEMLRPAQDGDDESNPEAVDSEQSLSQLRGRLLESLGRHDPMMARDLLRESQLPLQSDPAGSEASRTTDDKAAATRLELSLATQLVDQDPREAARIARRALDEGYPYELMYLLPKLAEKDPNAAKELVISIIAKLRKEDFATNYEAATFAMYLVSEAISSAQVDKEAEDKTEKRIPLLDPPTAREFIEFLTSAALKKQSPRSNGNLLMSLRSIIEALEQLAPAQASLLKQKFLEMDKESGSDADPYARFHQLSQTNDTKAMLEFAGTAPREVRDGLYSETASLAWEQGDKAKANEIITTKISSSAERSRLLSNFQEQAIAELVAKEEFVQARQLINQMRSSHERVQQLIELAAAIMGKGDKKVALEILQEAHGLVSGKAQKLYELEAQLKIAGALSELDVDRSFGIIDSAIDQINELMAATALIAGFDYAPTTLRDDEFTIDPSSTIRYGFSALSPKYIRTLAQIDFNRTKETFGRFQRPELRLTAYLLMAQSILEPEPTMDDCTCQERERLKKMKSKAASDLPDQAPR
jgi:hypothetical protein